MMYKNIHASSSLSFINWKKKNKNKKEVKQIIITMNIKYFRGMLYYLVATYLRPAYIE